MEKEPRSEEQSRSKLGSRQRLAVRLATAKRLPSAKDSLLSPDVRTSKTFSDGHMLLSIDSYRISKTPPSNNPSLDVSF